MADKPDKMFEISQEELQKYVLMGMNLKIIGDALQIFEKDITEGLRIARLAIDVVDDLELKKKGERILALWQAAANYLAAHMAILEASAAEQKGLKVEEDPGLKRTDLFQIIVIKMFHRSL